MARLYTTADLVAKGACYDPRTRGHDPRRQFTLAELASEPNVSLFERCHACVLLMDEIDARRLYARIALAIMNEINPEPLPGVAEACHCVERFLRQQATEADMLDCKARLYASSRNATTQAGRAAAYIAARACGRVGRIILVPEIVAIVERQLRMAAIAIG